MKYFSFIIIALLLLGACQENTDPTQDLSILEDPSVILPVFSGEEGAIIDLIEGQTMTLKYQRAYPTQTKAFFIGSDYLKSLLNQKSSLGVRFYLGVNGTQQYQLLATGVDNAGVDLLDQLIVQSTISCSADCNTASPLWHGSGTTSTKIAVSTNDGEGIDLDQAKALTHLYQDLHPESQKAFYFGQDVLQELLKEPTIAGLWFYMGINELDELELLPTTDMGNTNARLADGGSTTVADRSKVCPPDCDGDSPLLSND